MKYTILIVIKFTFILSICSCLKQGTDPSISISGSNTNGTTNSGPPNDPPFADNIGPNDGIEGIEQIINLSYSDSDGDLATSCNIFSISSSLTVTTPCSCAAGSCSIGITPDFGFKGSVNFSYNVTANSQVSNNATANYIVFGTPMVTSWVTTTALESITLPLRSGFSYNFTVDWGDGSPIDTILTWNDSAKTHNYAAAGTYTVTMKGTAEAWYFNNGGDKAKLYDVYELGNMGWRSFENAFMGCSNLTTVNGGNTSQVLNMSSMFFNAVNADPDTSGWDTSNVTNMASLFSGASSANPDVSGWDTSSVTNMSSIFKGLTSANPDVSGWDTSSVTNMSFAFGGASAATPDVSSWNTTIVTNLSYMFWNASSANPDVSGWVTSNVTNLQGMFYNAVSANPVVTGWDTSSVANMSSMFWFASSANPDVSGWSTESVTTMANMFNSATSANPDVSGWSTESVTTMANMFNGATSADPNMSGWNFGSVTSMIGMFNGTTISTTNYSNMLNRIVATSAQSGVTLSAGGAKYNSGALSSRAALIVLTWTITDGGPE